jgi:Zn-dependent peptidase ImmA (M78 family)
MLCRKSVYGIGVTVGLLLTGVPALGQSPPPAQQDPLIKNGPPIWDANRDGVYTCDEWKKFAERIFTSADRNHDGKLDPTEFVSVQKMDPALAEADFGYFDEDQDGKITRKEFVEKPSAFILRFDRNGDCKVTNEEVKATMDLEKPMHLRKLLEATHLEPVNKLPRFDSEEYDNDAEKIAGLVRRFWQIPDGPIHDVTALVENAGILVAHSDLGGSSVSGVRFSVPGMPHLIVLNRAQSADRMRFTLCHEVGHVIMHSFPTQNMEEEADTFASCFLVPTADVKPYFAGRKIDLRLLAALKPEWKVSMASLVFAAKRAGFLNETQAQYIWKQFNIHKIRLREPPELDFPRRSRLRSPT